MAPSGGTNLDYARSFNRNVMIEAVRLKGPVSRAELTRMTHLSAQTVSNIVAELLNAGLLLEEGRRQAKRGQPAIDLVLNPDGAATIGLTVEQSQLTAILVNLVGNHRLHAPLGRRYRHAGAVRGRWCRFFQPDDAARLGRGRYYRGLYAASRSAH
jgi:hypothetical protein